MSFLSAVKSSLKDVLTSKPWWRQQGWVVVTEILMGFLAAWGIIQSIPAILIGLGLGLVYIINCIGLTLIRKYRRNGGYLVALIGICAIFATLGFGGDLRYVRWFGFCVSIGALLAFRDNQNITSTAWLPIRAKKNGGNNMRSLTATSICSAVLLAVCLYLSGIITQAWKWWPYLIAIIGYGVFVPTMIAQLKKGNIIKTPVQWHATEHKQILWLLKLGTAFNAVNFLGRRLVIPTLIIFLAKDKFGGDDVLPLLGAVLGLVGILGALVRAPVVAVSKISVIKLLTWGARLSLLGWAILSFSLLISHQIGYSNLLIIFIILGWVIMEFTNRTWSIAYMEQLRVWTVGPRFSAARAHKRSLHKFMVRRSAGGAVGCIVGGVAGPVFAPAIVLVFLVASWWILENIPQEENK